MKEEDIGDMAIMTFHAILQNVAAFRTTGGTHSFRITSESLLIIFVLQNVTLDQTSEGQSLPFGRFFV